MRPSTDRDLIARSCERHEAFELIFDRHAAQIMRYLRLRVGDHLAEELTAETFTQAFRCRHRFSSEHESALPWSHGIAGNLLRTHRRAEQRRLGAYARAAAMQALATPGPDHALELVALTPVLVQGLTVLPATQRDVLLLRAWAELSHEEIGEVLGISEGLFVRGCIKHVSISLRSSNISIRQSLRTGRLGGEEDEPPGYSR